MIPITSSASICSVIRMVPSSPAILEPTLPANTMAMIEVKNISKSFDGKQVLFDINGTFEKGKTNLIIGASGTGKSVLLKSIVGLIPPDEGNVLYDGRNFTTADKYLKPRSEGKLVCYSRVEHCLIPKM